MLNRMNRRTFLSLAGAGTAFWATEKISFAQLKGKLDRPNVIYLFSDTHRWGAMSFTQTPSAKTPNMERMRRNGISLDRCYSNHPICTPYRAILLTGRWPWQQGLMANHMSLNDRVDLPAGQRTKGTLGWMFKSAGYATGYFGKWHLGGDDAQPFGFDKSIIWGGTNNHMKNPYTIDGKIKKNWNRGTTDDSNCTPTVSQALEWLEGYARESKPFLAMVSLNPPHSNMLDAPEGEKAKYPNLESLPWHPHDTIHKWDEHQGYHAHVSDVDTEVGRVLSRLEELGIADNTIFIYSSDHGGMSGVRGISYGQKRNPEDESVRVPFLIQRPGTIPSDVRLDTLFSTIDHLPTICKLAGLEKQLLAVGTEEAKSALAYIEDSPGVDLSKNILGKAGGPEPDSVFIMHPSNMNNNSPAQTVFRGVVTKEYTYAVSPEKEYCLYDNTGEYQQPNLVDRKDLTEVKQKLLSKIDAWIKKAETPYIDTWFSEMNPKEVQAWNVEHGHGKTQDREVGKKDCFSLDKIKL